MLMQTRPHTGNALVFDLFRTYILTVKHRLDWITMLPANVLTGAQTIASLAAGERTMAEIIDDHNERYAERDEILRAWASFRHDKAISEAMFHSSAHDDGRERTPDRALAGLMVGVKDLIGMCSGWSLPTEY